MPRTGMALCPLPVGAPIRARPPQPQESRPAARAAPSAILPAECPAPLAEGATAAPPWARFNGTWWVRGPTRKVGCS